MTGGFLALSLLLPTAGPPAPSQPNTPGPVGLGAGAQQVLQKGDELTFTGTVDEAVERPGNRFRRSQKLEIRVLVLERKETWTDVAVLTLLRRTDDAITSNVGAVTGAPAKPAPLAVRLDLVRVHSDGSVHHLHPVGSPPFTLDAKTTARTLPPVPLDVFAPFEFGMFPPQPPRSAPNEPWTVASADPNRPAENWQAKGNEFVTAERCTLLVMNQQHPNWAKPVGGQSAWYRADAVWVSPLDGTARKVHRVITHRDGIATEFAAWVEVKFELKDHTRAIGRTFDRYRRDVETAFATSADVAPFLADARKYGAKFFETRLQKLDVYLEEPDFASPYREAVQAVRRQLEAARNGETVARTAAVTLAPVGFPSAPKQAAWPEVGQLAPDFSAGQFRLADSRGKPVVLVFFKPGSDTTERTLGIAEALNQKFGSRAAIVPLAVWGTVEAGEKDRDRMKWTIPIYDGAQADTAYGIESVPRFVVIDGRGRVKWTFAGVGAETGQSARQQLERLFPPTSPNAPTGTIRAPGAGSPGLMPGR